jgi:hypothetical protein
MRRGRIVTLAIEESGVGTVFIASAVEVQSWWRAFPLVDEVASVIHLHGGRAEDGPYGGFVFVHGRCWPSVEAMLTCLEYFFEEWYSMNRKCHRTNML